VTGAYPRWRRRGGPGQWPTRTADGCSSSLAVRPPPFWRAELATRGPRWLRGAPRPARVLQHPARRYRPGPEARVETRGGLVAVSYWIAELNRQRPEVHELRALLKSPCRANDCQLPHQAVNSRGQLLLAPE
jgi:hypothetical protein